MKLRVLGLLVVLAVSGSAASSWAEQKVDDQRYTNSVFNWSISYPKDWVLGAQDPTFVKISPPAGLPSGLVGIHSVAGLRPELKSLDDYVDFLIRAEAQKQGFRILSRKSTVLSDGTPAVDVINVLGTGPVGQSRKVCVVVQAQGFCINAETYLNSWAILEPFFEQIIGSFVPVRVTSR